MSSETDPGYGDPRAPVGSPEWAKRWRLEFQNVVKSLPTAPAASKKFYDLGSKYRAWTLLTDMDGKVFAIWEDFCRCKQPWGLGTDPVKFKAYLAAEIGDKAADLITVPPVEMGRPEKGEGKVSDQRTLSGRATGHDKAAKLRAILRAPELVQDLYREGLITQTTAAKMGPKSPTSEVAGKIANARDALKQLSRPKEGKDRQRHVREFRQKADQIINQALGRKARTPLDDLQRAWDKASLTERREFLKWMKQSDGRKQQPDLFATAGS